MGGRVLDTFSGIGGMALGFEMAGWEVAAMVENDPWCQGILRRHWPTTPIYNDMREFDGRPYRGTVRAVAGGFPCQPYSNAGNRRGSADDRALWPELYRVIREAEPRFVLCENVTGIVHLELDTVLADLEAAGYTPTVFDIPAAGMGAHHIRHRIWVVAYANGDGVRDRPEREPGRWEESVPRQRDAFAEYLGEADDPDADSGRREVGRQQEHRSQLSEPRAEPDRLRERGWWARQGEWFVGDTISEGLEGFAGDVPFGDQSGRLREEAIRSARASGFLSGRPAEWPPEPRVGRVADGIPNRVDRIRGLGNSVVPQLVAVIANELRKFDEE